MLKRNFCTGWRRASRRALLWGALTGVPTGVLSGVLFGVLLLTAPAQAQTQAQGQVQAQVQANAPAQASTSSAVPTAIPIAKADQQIMIELAMANMAEIEAARLTLGKSQREPVRVFAQQMIDDHTKALTEVKQLAQRKGIVLPNELDRQRQTRLERLAAMSGETFERTYLAQAGVADHKKNHDMLRQAQGRTQDTDIKALAARLTPTVNQHLDSAQQLHRNKATARGNSSTGTVKTGN